MLICGVDNGLDGGLVILDGTKIVAREIMPTINVKDGKREYDSFNIIKIFQQFKPEHVFIERAQAMPGQGVTSMFSIGLGHGILRGILAGLALPHSLVHPRAWQSAMFRDLPKTDTKAMSAIVCGRLWPTEDWRASPRCKKAHDWLTDAALIAEFGRRTVAVNEIDAGEVLKPSA